MSTESVEKFIEQVESNPSLQEEIKKVLDQQDLYKSADAVTEIAQANGYNFSADELRAEVNKRQSHSQNQTPQGEISDEELEAVAGGALQQSISFNSVTITINDPSPPSPAY